MKKLHLCLISTLLAASVHAQSIDYTKGLSIWFDKPNNLDGRASWYAPTADKSWESNSLPIGNGSLGGNILGYERFVPTFSHLVACALKAARPE